MTLKKSQKKYFFLGTRQEIKNKKTLGGENKINEVGSYLYFFLYSHCSYENKLESSPDLRLLLFIGQLYIKIHKESVHLVVSLNSSLIYLFTLYFSDLFRFTKLFIRSVSTKKKGRTTNK